MIERERPVRVSDGKSGLEQAMVTILASLDAPPYVRELHFAWCCEHPKARHFDDQVIPWCASCWFEIDPETRFEIVDGAQPEQDSYLHEYSHKRDWRFDFAWPDLRIAAEVEGGSWAGGRHTRGRGFEEDCEKYNAAAEAGWRVFRFTGAMVEDGRAREVLERVLKGARS